MRSREEFGFARPIQIRADCFEGDRPPGCPHCGESLHRHGTYDRCAGTETVPSVEVQRFFCPRCRRTTSVLPMDRLPYRPWSERRLEAEFHRRAGIGSGPDPPPGELEAGGLKRAWLRLGQRRDRLRRAFGQLIDAATDSIQELWRQLIQAKGSVGGILRFLAQTHNSSLLGDYPCLRPNRS